MSLADVPDEAIVGNNGPPSRVIKAPKRYTQQTTPEQQSNITSAMTQMGGRTSESPAPRQYQAPITTQPRPEMVAAGMQSLDTINPSYNRRIPGKVASVILKPQEVAQAAKARLQAGYSDAIKTKSVKGLIGVKNVYAKIGENAVGLSKPRRADSYEYWTRDASGAPIRVVSSRSVQNGLRSDRIITETRRYDAMGNQIGAPQQSTQEKPRPLAANFMGPFNRIDKMKNTNLPPPPIVVQGQSPKHVFVTPPASSSAFEPQQAFPRAQYPRPQIKPFISFRGIRGNSNAVNPNWMRNVFGVGLRGNNDPLGLGLGVGGRRGFTNDPLGLRELGWGRQQQLPPPQQQRMVPAPAVSGNSNIKVKIIKLKQPKIKVKKVKLQ